MADDAPPPAPDGPDTAAASRIAAIFPDSPLSDVPDDDASAAAPGPPPPAGPMKRSADEATPTPTPPPARKRARTAKGAAAAAAAAAQGKLDEGQRRAVLRADPLARNVEANRVFCAECKKWVKLGEGVRYRVKHWAGHCALVHKRDKQTADAIEAEGVANAAKAAASPRAARANDPNGADDAGPSTAPPPPPLAPRKLRDHSKAAARRKSASPAPALALAPKPAPAPRLQPQSAPPPPPPPPQVSLDRGWQVLTAQNFVQQHAPPPPPPPNPHTYSFAPPPPPALPPYTHAADPYGFMPVLNGPMLGGEPVFMTFPQPPQPFLPPAPPQHHFAQQQQYAQIPHQHQMHFPAPISHHHHHQQPPHQAQQELGDDADADGSADEDAVGSPDPTA